MWIHVLSVTLLEAVIDTIAICGDAVARSENEIHPDLSREPGGGVALVAEGHYRRNAEDLRNVTTTNF